MNNPVIVSAVRTPVGRFLGGLSSLTAPELGGIAVREAISRAGIEANLVEEAILGNVVQAGVGQNPARQASIRAGLPDTVPAMTVGKVCGSGLKATHLGAEADDPYVILGVLPDVSDEVLRAAWRQQVSASHPDRARARGLPSEFIEVAEGKTAAINAAFDAAMKERRELDLVGAA